MPADLQLVSSWRDAEFNLDYRRYQQHAAPLGTFVDGSQLTVVSRAGEQLIVAGAYYPAARSVRAPALSAARALSLAADQRGGMNELPEDVRGLATRRAELRLDPVTGRLFYLVATGAPGANRYQEIDAQTGELRAAWSGIDQLSPGKGIGVKGDTKTLTPGTFATAGDLTSQPDSSYRLHSNGAKFKTYSAGNGTSYPSIPMSDSDDVWDATPQAAAVDAQYYAALTVQFYIQELGWDWFAQCSGLFGPTVRSVVHYGTNYDNAYWDDIYHYMVYGDGNSTWRALSAGQDVVSHELSHGVTQCRADLRYKDESGALNEAFSDIMATSAEWTLEEPVSSNCRLAPGQTECADWLLGEDLARTASGAIIRDLADPAAEGQPSHYEDLVYIGTKIDNGGVHYNSGIVNHAYYLLVNGGRNARCSGPADPQADCDVFVSPISLDHAADLFFNGFGLLSYDATMCDARNSTVAAAQTLYPGSIADQAAILLAWQAVGLGSAVCAQSADFSISLADPTLELAPSQEGQLLLSLDRGLENDAISFQVDVVAPATITPNAGPALANGSSQLTVTADNDALDGTYPILITATGSGAPHYTAASLVIDATAPSVAVANVRFQSMATVATSGTVPLKVTWSASDAGSGVASTQLDHSPNGSGWSAIYGPGVPASPTQFDTTAGPHQFQVVATDGVGNDATSQALVSSLTAHHESAATLKYPGSWSTSKSTTAWGMTIFSKRRGASATFVFTGTDVAWVAQRGPKRGVARVFVDGVRTVVDLYATTLSERRVVFVAANLPAGQHTIKIVVRGTYGRPRVDLDGFFVLSQ